MESSLKMNILNVHRLLRCRVDACPNGDMSIGRPSYDDLASPTGIILNDQSNQLQSTQAKNAPHPSESRGIRGSRSSLRVSRLDISRFSEERRDDRRFQSLDRRFLVRNDQRRSGERRRESVSVDRNSRRFRERDSISFRNDRRVSEIGADRRARRIRTHEPLQRRADIRNVRLATISDPEDRESRRRDLRSLKRGIVNENSRYQSVDRSVQRGENQRNRRFLSERDSAPYSVARLTSEQRNYQRSDRRIRDTRAPVISRIERSADRVNRQDRVLRSLERDSGTGSSRLRISERRDERRVRESRNTYERESAIEDLRVGAIRRGVRSSVRDSTTRRILEQTSERRTDRVVSRRRVQERRSLSRSLNDFSAKRRDDRRILGTEIRNRRSLERDSEAKNRYNSLDKRSQRLVERSLTIRTSPMIENKLARTNSLRSVRNSRTRSGERSSIVRLDSERSDSRRGSEVRRIVDHLDSRVTKEDTNRFEARGRSRTRKSEPLIREVRFMVSKGWEEQLSSSSSVYSEGIKQTAILILCAVYGASLYGGKSSFPR